MSNIIADFLNRLASFASGKGKGQFYWVKGKGKGKESDPRRIITADFLQRLADVVEGDYYSSNGRFGKGEGKTDAFGKRIGAGV